MSKNYCRDHEFKPSKRTDVTWREKIYAFISYLKKPKTIFDFKDRSKALIILAFVVLVLQYLFKQVFE